MLGFNESELRAQIDSALALRPAIEELAEELVDAGIDSILLVGSGGTYAQMWPHEYNANRISKLPVRSAISRELILSGDALLGPNTLVVFTSASGTTEDVLAAMEYVNEKGAKSVSFTCNEESPIAKAATYTLTALPKTWPFDMQLTFLLGKIFSLRGEFDGYESLANEMMDHLTDALISAAHEADEQASRFAESHADTDYHFLIGGGPLWGFTYLYSMCVLEEMQWLHTTRVNAAEFFHGSLELLESDTSIIVFQGEDETRPLTDRAESFAKRISNDVTVFDTKNYALEGFSPENRAIIAPIVLDTVMGRVSKHLERVRDHDLTLRRYYRVMEY